MRTNATMQRAIAAALKSKTIRAFVGSDDSTANNKRHQRDPSADLPLASSLDMQFAAGTRRRVAELAVLSVLGFSLLAVGDAQTGSASVSATPTCVQVTETVTTDSAAKGSVFTASDVVVTHDAGQTVTLSATCDGTGDVFVDDAIAISVIAGSERSFTHDFSGNCTAITPEPAFDLTALFDVGQNTVHIAGIEKCGGVSHMPTLYLVFGQALREGCIKVADAQAHNPHVQIGSTFSDWQQTVAYSPDQRVFLSTTCDATGETAVDDQIVVDVSSYASSQRFSHDYSNGCAGVITSQAPADLTHLFREGSNTTRVRARELCGGVSYTPTLYLVFSPPPNQSPVVTFDGAAAGEEGSPIPLLATAVDPDDDAVTVSWEVVAEPSQAQCVIADPSSLSTTVTCQDNGDVTVRITATDGIDGSFDEGLIAVSNAAPVVTISRPTDGQLFRIGEAVDVSAFISDAGAADSHTCSISFGDASSPVDVTAVSRTCSAVHSYGAAGVYYATATATDDDGGVDEHSVMLVVYDPEGGFVTGGGWITSPSGAYTPDDPNDADHQGKATFGFVSKYQKGAAVPTGNTEFQLRAATFNFKSASYEWLVVSGTKAQYKGSGMVNGVGDFGFLLTANDGDLTGGGGTDRFRIKIWDRVTDKIIYDNQPGASDDADGTGLDGGSIIIHK